MFFEIDVDALWNYLRKLFEERIVILDGAMGTEIQKHKLQEEHYRGKDTFIAIHVMMIFQATDSRMWPSN